MKTCKECEHYEFYDGPEKASFRDKPAIMVCKNHGDYHSTTEIRSCSGFTPKKPVEPERSCRDCENSKYKEGALFCGSYNTYPSNISVTAKECSCFAPIKPDKPKAEVPEKEKRAIAMERMRLEYNAGIAEEPTKYHKKVDKRTETQETKKEKTMSRMKKRIRQFVMGCTLYCTAVICIALNPYVIWLCYKVLPMGNGQIKDANYVDIFMCWLSTITAIVVVALAIYAYNKAIDYVFGKLEK